MLRQEVEKQQKFVHQLLEKQKEMKTTIHIVQSKNFKFERQEKLSKLAKLYHKRQSLQTKWFHRNRK